LTKISLLILLIKGSYTHSKAQPVKPMTQNKDIKLSSLGTQGVAETIYITYGIA